MKIWKIAQELDEFDEEVSKPYGKYNVDPHDYIEQELDEEAIKKGEEKRQYYQKNVDQKFLNKLTLIHWSTFYNIWNILSNKASYELSTIAYLSPPYEDHWMSHGKDIELQLNPLGLVVKGKVVLGGSTDLWSNSIKGIKYPGENTTYKDLVLNESQYMLLDEDGFTSEYFVSDWKPIALVYDDINDKHLLDDNYKTEFIKMAKRFSLPLLDRNGSSI
jgi:hypothetical protein